MAPSSSRRCSLSSGMLLLPAASFSVASAMLRIETRVFWVKKAARMPTPTTVITVETRVRVVLAWDAA